MKISSNLSERIHHLVEQRTFPEMLIVIILILNISLTVYVAALINTKKMDGVLFFFHLKLVLLGSNRKVSQEKFWGRKSHLNSEVYVEWHLTALDYTYDLKCMSAGSCSQRDVVWLKYSGVDSQTADDSTCTGQIHINHSFRGTKQTADDPPKEAKEEYIMLWGVCSFLLYLLQTAASSNSGFPINYRHHDTKLETSVRSSQQKSVAKLNFGRFTTEREACLCKQSACNQVWGIKTACLILWKMVSIVVS